MKKFTIQIIIIIALLVFPAISLFSQNGQNTKNPNFALYEDFSGLESLPEGWSVMGLGINSWEISNTNNAGGIAPELVMDHTPNILGISRFVTPVINTEGLDEIALTFRHYLLFYWPGNDSIKIETTSDGGATWNLVWSRYVNATIEAETKMFNITTPDVGSPNMQIAFTFSGNTQDITNWKIDEIAIGDPFFYDATVTIIDIPKRIKTGEAISPAGVVKNKGQETASFDATFTISEPGVTAIYSETLSVVDLANNESITLTFPEWIPVEGDYDATLSVNLSGDEDPSNDDISKQIEVINDLILLKPIFQVFTSSTCSCCGSANVALDDVLAENENAYSLIKYQTSFPYTGDPYYCEDVGIRTDYYGVTYVPAMFILDDSYSHPYFFTPQKFDDLTMIQTFMNITIESATINNDNLLELTATIDVSDNYNAGLRAHIAIVEKTTYENTGTNGETEFHNVLMKMLPDGDGTVLGELTPGNTVDLSGSYDMNLTFMEEADDLAIVVFVQDDTDESIVQSEMIDVSVTIASGEINVTTMDISFGKILVGNTSEEIITISNQGTATLEVSNIASDNAAFLIDVTTLTIEPGNSEDVTITFEPSDGVLYEGEISIQSNDPENATVIVEVSGEGGFIGIDELSKDGFVIYPNPTTEDKFYVKISVDAEKLQLISISGQIVLEKAFVGNKIEINTSKLNPGMYFLKLISQKNKITKKLIVN